MRWFFSLRRVERWKSIVSFVWRCAIQERDELMERFSVAVCVIDGMPETHATTGPDHFSLAFTDAWMASQDRIGMGPWFEWI
jgi:hypothetical protein